MLDMSSHLPSPAPSQTPSDCEHAKADKQLPNPNNFETHEPRKPGDQEQSKDKAQQCNAASTDFTTGPDLFDNGSSANVRQTRKRGAEEEFAGQAKWKRGPVGHGSHQFATASSFRSSLNKKRSTIRTRRTFKDLKSVSKAIDEFIDEAPKHTKDITKAEITRYFRSLSLKVKPTLEDGDRRWTVKGLKTALRLYQAIGAGRMRWLEKRLVQPKFGGSVKLAKSQDDDLASDGIPRGGGILADEMGLGSKCQFLNSVSMLMLLRNNPGVTHNFRWTLRQIHPERDNTHHLLDTIDEACL